MGDGWERAPLRRITLIDVDAGAQLMLALAWSHSDWRGHPGEVYGFLWASLQTLANESNLKPGAARKRLKKLYDAGFVLPLRGMTSGELYLANFGRGRVGIPPIVCSCKSGERSGATRNECSCRVLRPIGDHGQLIRDPPNGPPDLQGLHVGRARSDGQSPTGE